MARLRDETCRGRQSADGDPRVARAHVVCAECRHARLFAVQPRAICTCRGAPLEGSIVFSGQPACAHIQPRQGDDRMLAWCSLRAATRYLHFAQVRPRLY